MVRTGIVREAILPEEVLADLSSPEDGACLLFLGVVRNHNRGREVDGLDYETYQTMAEKTLQEIAQEASHRYGTDRISVLHRVGSLQVGEVSTAIAVATPHRAESYEASRYIIEELKRRLPVWKRERYAGGDSSWLGEADTPPEGEVRDPGGPSGETGEGEVP